MSQAPDPLSRRQRQQQTREALVTAALAVFAEDGYHAASLDRISREAGFSKGAVYSNFDGKPALFLAVMDRNLQRAEAHFKNPFDEAANPASTGRDMAAREGYPEAATQGFALATLEFIAAASRDEKLAPQLHQRLAAVLEHYEAIAQETRADDDSLSASDLGKLLAALDQGAGLILLAGGVMPEPAIFNAGMRRLVDPARAATGWQLEA